MIIYIYRHTYVCICKILQFLNTLDDIKSNIKYGYNEMGLRKTLGL